MGRLEEPALAQQRGCTDFVVNSHGRRLSGLCSQTGSLLCTGRLPGDEHAPVSFRAGARQSRVDHILVPHEFLSQVQGCTVNTARVESDHAPLEADLCIPVPQNVQYSDCLGVHLTRRHWCVECHGPYSQALQSPASVAMLQDVVQAATDNNVDAAVQALRGVVEMAADEGGMHAKQSSSKSGPARAHQPFYDGECVALKRQLRRVGRSGDPVARKELERRYHSLVGQKKRAYHLERLKQLLVDERMRPRHFWKALRAKPSDLPIGLQRVQAWGSYIGHLSHCGSAEGCSLPGVAYPQQPHACRYSAQMLSMFQSVCRKYSMVCTSCTMVDLRGAWDSGRTIPLRPCTGQLKGGAASAPIGTYSHEGAEFHVSIWNCACLCE